MTNRCHGEQEDVRRCRSPLRQPAVTSAPQLRLLPCHGSAGCRSGRRPVGSTRPVDDYLGHVELRGKRILEIGPASGFLTVEMEKRGALLAASTSP
jgi:hypothetical protein